MKLLTRTTLVYIAITAIVFTIGSVVFHSVLQEEVREETSESLYVKKNNVIRALEADTSLPSNSTLADEIRITEVKLPFAQQIKDTLIYEQQENEYQPYRMIRFPFTKNGHVFAITISKVMLESEDLVESIFISFLIILALLAAIVILSVQLLSKKIWKPFLFTLQEIQNYKPGSKVPLKLQHTSISEFQALNSSIEEMARNTEQAFNSMKSFSENAAHEIQTPLAVIISSAEVLLQNENLSEEEHNSIGNLQRTARRLSALTSTLLLLTKIENHQFKSETSINVSDLLKQKLLSLQELFDQKNINIKTTVASNVKMNIHYTLAEIIFSNLAVNALRHTPENGKVIIELNEERFSIRNTGNPLKGEASRIFERFYKEEQSESSTGLGLALVKQIADSAGLTIQYSYSAGMHSFQISLYSESLQNDHVLLS